MPLFDDELKRLTDGQREFLRTEVGRLIPIIAERIHYAEARRVNVATMAAGLIAAGIAVLVAILPAGEIQFRTPFIVLGLSFLAVGAAVWLIFQFQTNRYPWTSATTTWKWFYRDAIDGGGDFKLGLSSYFQKWKTGKLSKHAKEAFGQKLKPFGGKIIEGLADGNNSLEQDIQQLYVLHINEMYKNMFLSHLRDIFNYGLVVAIIATAAALAFDLLSEPVQRRHTSSPAWIVTSSWRALAPENSTEAKSTNNQLLANFAVKNTGAHIIRATRVTVRDAHGMTVPTSIVQGNALPVEISPNSTGMIPVVIGIGRVDPAEVSEVSISVTTR